MRSLLMLAAVALLATSVPFSTATNNVTVIALFGAGSAYNGGVPCPVSVPAGSNGGVVLDAAVAAGCITSWSSRSFSGFGRFLTCIDGVCGIDDAGATVDPALAGNDGTFWEFSVDHHVTSYGIDGYSAHDLDIVGFTYSDWWISLADFEASSVLP